MEITLEHVSKHFNDKKKVTDPKKVKKAVDDVS